MSQTQDDQNDNANHEPVTDINSLNINAILGILRRRKFIIILPILPLMLISFSVAVSLPPVYRSEAMIVVEDQRISDDLVKSTISSYADERIKLIQRKISTVENINGIIKKFGLYAGDHKSTDVELAENFSKHATLDLVSAEMINKGLKSIATIAFKLGFEDKSPEVAQRIATELATLYLNENIRNRTEQAEETSQFLLAETEKFKREIDKIEYTIAEYKQKHSESLPEVLTSNLASVSRLEGELQQLDLKEKMLEERKITLRTQLSLTSPTSVRREKKSERDLPDTLPELQTEYQRLITNFNDTHPDVKAVKRKIQAIEENMKNHTEDGNQNITNPAYLQVKSDIDNAQSELLNIEESRRQIKEKLKQLELNISQTHQVERGYDELLRDLENNKSKYQELRNKSLDAKLAVTMEAEGKSEKFTLLEPARLPIKPEKPKRMKIMLLGMVVSVVAGFGAGFAAEMLDGTIRGRSALVATLGFEPLVLIPYIRNDEDDRLSRKHWKILFIILFIFVVIFIFAVHFLYKPLDELFFMLLTQLDAA